MIVKSSILLLVFYTFSVNGKDYTLDHLAGGWLKFHQPASFEDASTRCHSEEAVLASPLNSQVRDGIKNFLISEGKGFSTILTGVKAAYESGDYQSVEGVPLTKMPVLVSSELSIDSSSTEGCLQWMTGIDEVKVERCSTVLPFVCFRKRNTVLIAGCGTNDPEYQYEERSGSCYKFHRKALPWSKAYDKCKREGGFLAVINSELEHRALKELFAKNPSNTITYKGPNFFSSTEYAFVGFRDWLDGESWKAVGAQDQTLEQAGFDKWVAGEPNNGHNNEHCGTLYREGNYNDADCSYALAFICEKKPEILYR